MKKRLISMFLALSMLFSLCPVSAFAEMDTAVFSADDLASFAAVTPTARLEFTSDGHPYVADNGIPRSGVSLTDDAAAHTYTYTGDGWSYKLSYQKSSDNSVSFQPPYILCLTQDADLNGQVISSDVDAVVSNNSTLRNATINGDLTIEPGSRVENVTCKGTTTNNGTIASGDFSGKVDNKGTGTIQDGTFRGDVSNNGTISGGSFTGKVDNNPGGNISGGDFKQDVTNSGTVAGGDFSGNVENKPNGTIKDGDFSGTVDNNGSVSGGTFSEVTGTGTISAGIFNSDKLPSNLDRNAARSVVKFLNGASFDVNGSLKGITSLTVLTRAGDSKTVQLTSSTPFRNLYVNQNGTETWQTLSGTTTADITVKGGTYLLNLNEYTANNFKYDPADHTVSWNRNGVPAPSFETLIYGPDDAQKQTASTNEPGSYVVKVNVAGSSTYMQAEGLTDSSWTFTVDPELVFVTATATANGKPVQSGVRLPVGTTITLTATSDNFKMWDLNNDPLATDAELDLTSREITFQMPKRNLNILASDTTVTPGGNSDNTGNAALITLGVAAGGFAFYYLGTTAFLRTILPQECAIPTNRESLANALWVMCGRPEPSSTTVFVDVPETSSALPAIRWAVEKGVMSGTVQSDGLHFAPARYTTRLEVFATWYRMYLNDSQSNS